MNAKNLILLAALALSIGGLPAAPPERDASKDQDIEIKGRVLDPDGKPLTGAKVYLLRYRYKDNYDLKSYSITDADGRFRFMAGPAKVGQIDTVVALAPPYAPDWVPLKEAHGNELTLRLVKGDVPIQGRVLDLEGRPVAGATAHVVRVLKTAGEDLTSYLKELQANAADRNAAGQVRFRHERNMTRLNELPESPPSVKTGPDGRFELRGFGSQRIVYLDIEGPSIESRSVTVMLQPDLAQRLPLDIYGPNFDFLAAPSKPIRGTVREKGSGKPIAGITIQVVRGKISHTDEHGRYRIDGTSKRSDYTVSAAGKPYFGAIRSSIADTPGFEPLVVDFELERGIEIRGRVVNKTTGKPIAAASISYHATADNPNLKKLAGMDRRGLIRDSVPDYTRPDGSFVVAGLPGPGYLTVLVLEDDYRKPDLPKDWRTIEPPVRYNPPLVHAWVRIDPSEKDPKSTHCDIALEPAKSLTGQVLDPAGKPLSGYFVAGLTGTPISVLNQLNLHETHSFLIRGLGPKRPRTLAILHPEKKLGKVALVRGDQTDPVQVRLEPLGAAAGRVLNADGQPQSGLQVRAVFAGNGTDENLSATNFQFQTGLRQHQLDSPARTDSAGKFRLDHLMPGLKYVLLVSESTTKSKMRIVFIFRDLAVESGKTKDLGDLKIKPSTE